MDGLLDHRSDFKLLVMAKLGQEEAEKIEWSNPRLLCIAGDFTKYDSYAVEQIDRTIELIRYRRYGEELLLLELVNASSGQVAEDEKEIRNKAVYATAPESLEKASVELKDCFEALKSFLLALGDDVQMKTLKYYFAFKRIKNFVCVEINPQAGKLGVYVKVDPDTIQLEEGFTRNVRGIGHYGTGDLEIIIKSDKDLKKAEPLLIKSYEMS